MQDDRAIMEASTNQDREAIDRLTADFFSVFSNMDGRLPDVRKLRSLMLNEAVIIKQAESGAEIYTLEEFILPRQKMLSDGTLTDFEEVELSASTDIIGRIARRACTYRKAGKLNGDAFEAKGAKLIQFVKVRDAWRISAVAWDDERDGLDIPAHVQELLSARPG